MEPLVESFCDNLGHWSGSVVLGQMIKKLGFCFSRAAVCWSLGQGRTWSISSHHASQAKHCLLILLSWVARWCSVGVQLWANLASWYCQPLVRQPKGSHTFPIDVIERSHLPVCCKERVMPFGFLNQLLAEPGSSSSSGDIIVLFLGDQFTMM
jgi:hypothetical protein